MRYDIEVKRKCMYELIKLINRIVKYIGHNNYSQLYRFFNIYAAIFFKFKIFYYFNLYTIKYT